MVTSVLKLKQKNIKMNERIKLLAELSKTPKTMMVDGVLQSVVTIDAERFAELIVRECVKVMYDNAIKRKVPPDINQTPTHYAVAVLEHFGVEE
jgi:hypothetical protein